MGMESKWRGYSLVGEETRHWPLSQDCHIGINRGQSMKKGLSALPDISSGYRLEAPVRNKAITIHLLFTLFL
jgi:hypothetical protein